MSPYDDELDCENESVEPNEDPVSDRDLDEERRLVEDFFGGPTA